MARIRLQLLGQQTLFSNQSSMIKFAKKTLEPILLEIFKNIDKDIYLCYYTIDLNTDAPDSWTIEKVTFKSTSILYDEFTLFFINGVSISILVEYSKRYPVYDRTPTTRDIIICILNYSKRPINFISAGSRPIEPGRLLEAVILIHDMEGAEIIGGIYGAKISASWIDYILDQQLHETEINGELVAWLLEFRKKHFGFDGSQDLPVL